MLNVSWKSPGNLLGWICVHPVLEDDGTVLVGHCAAVWSWWWHNKMMGHLSTWMMGSATRQDIAMYTCKRDCIFFVQRSCVNDSYNKAIACGRWCCEANSASSGRQSPGGTAFVSASLYSRFCWQCYLTARFIRATIWTRCAGVSYLFLY